MHLTHLCCIISGNGRVYYKKGAIPHGVEDFSIWSDPQELIWHCCFVQVGTKSIVEISVWLPHLIENCCGHNKFIISFIELQSLIRPCLPEVSVHGIRLGEN